MKRERVYREILYHQFEERASSFTQHELAETCRVSLGLVNLSLNPLRRMGAVEVRQRSFVVLDAWKVLMYWCAVRDLTRETVYSNLVEEPVHRIEASLPRGSVSTAYTAYRERFGEAPADYSEVYVYGDEDVFVRRFGYPRTVGRRNLFVLRSDERLVGLGKSPLAQVYADLWNIDKWYAKRYLESLGGKLRQMMPEVVS